VKLILCPHCSDVVKLTGQKRSCKCGRCSGRYLDSLRAEITPEAIPIGFDNLSLVDAVASRPGSGQGKPFQAFVIPLECPTIRIRENM
jgi:hypothetical protein